VLLKEINHVRYRRLLFSVNDFFLSKEQNTDADINYFIQHPVNLNNSLNSFMTLLIDLAQPEELIRSGMYHRTRSEIASFLNNQKYEHRLAFHLTTDSLKACIKEFNLFADQLQIRRAEAFRLHAYNREGILAVSCIRQNDDLLCMNFYRATRERATNLYSFTLKHRWGHKYNGSHFGRAHRALHWLDITAFKEMGARYYDFCGWYSGTDDEKLLRVNKFKEQFTQNKIEEFSGVIYNNKLLTLLKKLRRNG
jgi:hypothetical protein